MLVDAKTESGMLEDSKAGMHVDVLEGNNQWEKTITNEKKYFRQYLKKKSFLH